MTNCINFRKLVFPIACMYYAIVLLCFCSGCSDYVALEQEVSVDSRIDNTYYVQTKVWIRGGFPSTLEMSLEKWILKGDVAVKDISRVKSEQMIEAAPIVKAAEAALKTTRRAPW